MLQILSELDFDDWADLRKETGLHASDELHDQLQVQRLSNQRTRGSDVPWQDMARRAVRCATKKKKKKGSSLVEVAQPDVSTTSGTTSINFWQSSRVQVP